MNTRIFVKPAPGMKVRKPVGGYLAEGGEWQNHDAYWRRRVDDKDAIEAQGPKEDEAAASSSNADAAAGRKAK